MAQSLKEYSGLESQTNPELSYSDIEVLTGLTNIVVILVNNFGLTTETKTTLTLNTHYTLDTDNKIVTIRSDNVPLTADDRIVILRTTSVTDPAVAFSDTALLTDTDLNKVVKQSLFKLQEVTEQSADGLDTTTLSLSGAVNANSQSIETILANNFVTNDRINTGAVNSDSILNNSILGEDLNINSVRTAIGDVLYPIGSVYCNMTNSADPSTILGFGTWTRIEGKVIVGLDNTDTDFDTLLESGGAKTHTLTSEESGLPSHAHNVYVSGNGGATGQNTSLSYSLGLTGSKMYHENQGHTSSGASSGIKTGETDYKSEDASEAHNNLQPYIVGALWYRTA